MRLLILQKVLLPYEHDNICISPGGVIAPATTLIKDVWRALRELICIAATLPSQLQPHAGRDINHRPH